MPERTYGTWRSPLSASMVAAGTVDVAHVAIEDGSVWWLERRPDEDGRGVDLRAPVDAVADLAALARETHKFESRYLEGLVGPLPEAEDRYRERSPAFHADDIDCPLLQLQGGEDRVVPPGQAEDMVDALVDSGVPYAYVLFPDERHGFRAAASRQRALEMELAFYGEAFGFDPADDLPTLALVRGEYRKRAAED